jgi:hypothetical protein
LIQTFSQTATSWILCDGEVVSANHLFSRSIILAIMVLEWTNGLPSMLQSESAQGDAAASGMGGRGRGGAAMRGRGGRGMRRR